MHGWGEWECAPSVPLSVCTDGQGDMGALGAPCGRGGQGEDVFCFGNRAKSLKVVFPMRAAPG